MSCRCLQTAIQKDEAKAKATDAKAKADDAKAKAAGAKAKGEADKAKADAKASAAMGADHPWVLDAANGYVDAGVAYAATSFDAAKAYYAAAA